MELTSNQSTIIKMSAVFTNFGRSTMKTNLLFYSLCIVVVDVANSVEQLKCKSVIAYYVGKFQNPLDPSDIFNLEFQLKLEANDTDQNIYVRADKWNSSLADPGDFQLQFFYDGGFQL
jgi:hypothetical protein